MDGRKIWKVLDRPYNLVFLQRFTNESKLQQKLGAANGSRTHDLVLTKDALYQLSYSSIASLTEPQKATLSSKRLCRRRGLPHPINYSTKILSVLIRNLIHEAGEGSRTLVGSLEGYRSTVELHPRGRPADRTLSERFIRRVINLAVVPKTLPLLSRLTLFVELLFLHLARAQMIRFSRRGTCVNLTRVQYKVGSEGFEPSKALPSDLQSDPFDRSGNPPPLLFLCFPPWSSAFFSNLLGFSLLTARDARPMCRKLR